MYKSATPGSGWKIERSGNFGIYEVVGWRYCELAVWHVNTCVKNAPEPAKVYMIAAGEFYPNTAGQDERFAILHLLSLWEGSGGDTCDHSDLTGFLGASAVNATINDNGVAPCLESAIEQELRFYRPGEGKTKIG